MVDTDRSEWKAGAQDLPSIGTLHARAFHPKIEWHRKVFPASIAPWWEERYAQIIDNPIYEVLKISSPDSPSTVIGLLSMRRFTAEERGAGTWSSFPAPPQGDREGFEGVHKSMVEYRERFMMGRPHFNIEHFGVDAGYQGSGVGSRIIAKACEIADREELDMFVEANEFAESFYQRHGFETEMKQEMPGGMAECFLIRRSRKAI